MNSSAQRKPSSEVSQFVEVKAAPNVVFIGASSFKPFIRTTGALLMVFGMNFMVAIITMLFDRKSTYQGFFRDAFIGFSSPGNGYDIASYVVLGLSLALMSVFPRVARSSVRFAFIGAIYLSQVYLALFWAKQSIKVVTLDFRTLFLVYTALFSSYFSIYCNVMQPSKTISVGKGIAFGCCSVVLLHLSYKFVFLVFDHIFRDILIGCAITIVLSGYFNLDAVLMVKHRSDYYLNNDWALGFAHLHTDFTFRFWRDLMKSMHGRGTGTPAVNVADETARRSQDLI